MNELLEQLVDSLGVSRSQFAKNINMDRSQVVKTINGSLPVSKRFYKAIMAAAFIGDDFKQKFAAEYNKSIPVTNHGLIIDRFFAELKKPAEAVPAEAETELGRLICSCVKDAFARGQTVYAIGTRACADAENALLRALKETGAKSLKRINPTALALSEKSIDDLFDVAAYACLGVQTYVAQAPFNGLLPFGVCSESFAVAFDAEAHYAVIRDADVCLSLAQKYGRLSADLRQAVDFTEDEASTLLRNADYNYGQDTVYLYNHFSPIGIVDYHMLVDAANPELNDAVRENLAYATAMEYEQRANASAHVYYTSCAVEDFVRTGRIAAITDRYLQPFSVSARIEMLRRLRELVKNEKATVIKTDGLRFSGDIAIGKTGVDLCICGRQSLRSDLYCAHFYLRNDRIYGLEGLANALKASLQTRPAVMSQIGAEYYLNSLISSLNETRGAESNGRDTRSASDRQV